MSYKIWKPNKSNDYTFFDSVISEQYRVGGVDMFLYTYEGATGNAGSTDSTKPDASKNMSLLTVGDKIFGETVNRKYSPEAIVLSCVYQVQEAAPDIKIPGMFFNFNTMDITVHYNTMMQLVGRKIIAGDVLELPNLRDTDVYGSNVCINKWYTVQDSFKAAEGYSVTWNHHIWKLRVKPLTDSPEFSDIVDKIKEQYPDTTDPNNNPDNTTGVTTSDKELQIMNAIIGQADSEVRYMHWDNEHIYDDTVNSQYYNPDMPSNYIFPSTKKKGMYFKLLTAPVLHEYIAGNWEVIDSTFGTAFPLNPNDADFFFKSTPAANPMKSDTYSLHQYDSTDKTWYECTIEGSDSTIPASAVDFWYSYKDPEVYNYNGNNWVLLDPSFIIKPFTSKGIASNRTTHDDVRGAIPPKRGTIPEGDSFPTSPTDGMQFYRTDFTPCTIWQYNAEQSKWTLFPYGGRLPWVGADWAQAEYLNSPDRVSIHDVVKPNIKQ